MKKIIYKLCVLALMLSSCEKYLDVKPDAKLAVPSSAADLRMILDNYTLMNNGHPIMPEVMSDNYYVTQTDWKGLGSEVARNLYLWQRDENNFNDWNLPYKSIFYTNVVLDELKKIDANQLTAEHKSLKGAALCLQAHYYYVLAQVFAQPLELGVTNPYGLPLREDSDFNKPVIRQSVQETYQKIVELLQKSIPLLPIQEKLKTRPTKAMAYGILGRTYLLTGDYGKAALYADSALQLQSSLMDFNLLNAAAAAPIARFNSEVVFHARSLSTPILGPAIARIDTLLYASYHENDLRKKVYFREMASGRYAFKADYDGSGSSSGYVFWGLATDELYLIAAECEARIGNVGKAMQLLDTLLQSRFKKGTFIPLTAGNVKEAVGLVLNERRKELLFRGTRWSDMRRLSGDPDYGVLPIRKFGTETYTLQPRSKRYTVALPSTIVNISNLPQNP